ncbi:hypothetical protein JXA84_10010 [candidate division WOR-3 bacterium]|nr:hypothetical protein [candidate division WOR-3 bacterium]
MKFKNIDGMSGDDLLREITQGGKFVVFQYCVSIIILSFKRGSAIYFIKGKEKSLKYSFKYSLVTWLLGWWGIPWGPIFSIRSLYINNKGGIDVTKDVIQSVAKVKK